MVVGVCRLRLALHGVFSLKEKRAIIKRITARVRNSFPVSIAEVAENDQLRSAAIGFSVVGNDGAYVNSVVDTVLDFIEDLYLAEIIDQHIELISL
jgi:uncharacterized protein YlxP (DUF503 family)